MSFSWSLLQNGAIALRRTYIDARSTNEDDRRQEHLANILLVSLIVVTAVMGMVAAWQAMIAHSSYSGVHPASVGLWCAWYGLLLWVSRRGRIRTAIAGLLISLYLPTVIVMVRYGVTVPELVLLLALLVTISSVLVATRFSFLVTGIVSVTMLTVYFLQSRGVFVPEYDWRTEPMFVVSDIVPLVVTLFAIAIVAWLSNRETERSLIRARASEAALKKERDSLEEKVEERTRALKQAQMDQIGQLYRFAEFGKMASGHFHDLANPLTAVSLSLDQLSKESGERLLPVREHLDRAMSAAKRMEGYIGAVRKQLQQHEVVTLFHPAEEIRDIVNVLGYKARKAHVQMRLKLDDQITIKGNLLKFGQIVMNVVSNAIDAYEGIERKSMRDVIVSLEREKQTVYMTIRDHGCGIPEGDISKIFQPFFTTKREQGLGIGLATVSDIVKKDFGGSMQVQSVVGQGSTFTISLPEANT